MVFVDTYANWTLAKYNPSNYPIGSTFVISDWSDVTYIVKVVAGAQKWVWYSGVYNAALASLPTTGFNAAGLGANDTGLLFFENATYFHQLQWGGAAWRRGPNDLEHSDTFHEFGAAPTDGGWQVCDGSIAVTFLKYDGTTGARTVPNLATAAYAKSTQATYTAALTAPTAPTFTGTPATPAGSVSAPNFTGTPAAPAGSVSAPTFTGTPKTWDVVNVVSVAGTQSVLKDDGTNNPYSPGGTNSAPIFTGTPATPGGTNSAPIFTGTPATPAGTVALPGDPVENFSVIKFYRR
jgi:hypothetical protein